MKKNLSVILAAVIAFALFAAGCDEKHMQKENGTTEKPLYTGRVTGDGESVIEGFVEGMEIDEKDLPEEILNAVKKAADGLLISGVSYSTYVGKQTYRVILSETGMGTTREMYVTANGEVIPTDVKASEDAKASPSPTASPGK